MPPKKRKTHASRTTSPSETPKSKHAKTTTASRSNMVQKQPKNPFTSYPPSKVYRLVEPGPVLLVSTGPSSKSTSERSDVSSDVNLMTMGFHMMVQHSGPPLIAACIGPWDATYARLKTTRECVLAVPSVEMVQSVVDIGNCSMDDLESGPTSSKFEKFGLDALPADKVGAPLVGGEHVIANVECVVEDDSLVARYNLWVLRVVKAWVNEDKKPGEGGRMFHHRGDGTFSVDGDEVLNLRDRMVKWRMFQD